MNRRCSGRLNRSHRRPGSLLLVFATRPAAPPHHGERRSAHRSADPARRGGIGSARGRLKFRVQPGCLLPATTLLFKRMRAHDVLGRKTEKPPHASSSQQVRPVGNGNRSPAPHGCCMLCGDTDDATHLGGTTERLEDAIDGRHSSICTFRVATRQGETYSAFC